MPLSRVLKYSYKEGAYAQTGLKAACPAGLPARPVLSLMRRIGKEGDGRIKLPQVSLPATGSHNLGDLAPWRIDGVEKKSLRYLPSDGVTQT